MHSLAYQMSAVCTPWSWLLQLKYHPACALTGWSPRNRVSEHVRAYAQERIKKKNKPTSERLILLFNLEQASQCTKASCFQYHNTNKASNTNTTSTSSLKNIETALRSLGDAAGLHSDFVSWVMSSVLFGNWHWALLTPASGLICSLAYSMNGFKKKIIPFICRSTKPTSPPQ